MVVCRLALRSVEVRAAELDDPEVGQSRVPAAARWHPRPRNHARRRAACLRVAAEWVAGRRPLFRAQRSLDHDAPPRGAGGYGDDLVSELLPSPSSSPFALASAILMYGVLESGAV